VVEDGSIPVLIVSFPSGADLELYIMSSTVPNAIWSAFGWICQGSTLRRRHSFSTSTMRKGGGRQRDGGLVDVPSVFTSKVCSRVV
jgi:hypothetical protein